MDYVEQHCRFTMYNNEFVEILKTEKMSQSMTHEHIYIVYDNYINYPV